MKITVFWVASSTVAVVRCQSFGGISNLQLRCASDNLQGEKVLRNNGTDTKNRIYLFTYLLTYLLTYSKEQNPSSEANWFCS
jgi:hypothetical protein